MGAEGPVPGHLRCRRSDGKQWQCSRRAEDGKSFCEFHHLQALRRQSRRARQPVPEHLRCRRSDGKQWRCSRRAENGLSFCEIHHLQALRRQSRQPVPDSLKLPCLRRGADSAAQKDGGLDGKDAPVTTRKRGRKKVGNGELAMELIRMVVRQMLRRREEKEKRKREETTMDETDDRRGEVADDVASSSRIAPTMSLDFAGGDAAEGKLVLGTSSFLRWPFRSKNVERPPLVPSAQVWLPVRCSTVCLLRKDPPLSCCSLRSSPPPFSPPSLLFLCR